MTPVNLRLSLKANLTFCLLSSLAFSIFKLSFFTEKSTVLPGVTSVESVSLTEIFQPPPASVIKPFIAFSCATLTASVS